ncbi:uncharacterized protein STEHIDRAFT_59941, partial [Stereum hirsutum FP-91666 SS1]|uniref:uncharacterized protein n=1 Tax=Stereum hirsutum (strain FP-91666) TaxID=721885 RepID=UPI000444A900
MIARCRAKCWIVQLKEENSDIQLPTAQRGIKGHIIVYPQRPENIASVLPPSIEDIITPICVIFVGSKPPTDEWLREKAKPLSVRREKVRSALMWLKSHNPLYKDVEIDHNVLNSLENEQILPFHIEHVLPSNASDSLTSQYDAADALAANAATSSTTTDTTAVITDVDGNAPSNQLRAAALRHVKKQGGAYVEIPHDTEPMNEFNNPSLFPMIYPTLFPYGIGGFEDKSRHTKLSMKRQVKH